MIDGAGGAQVREDERHKMVALKRPLYWLWKMLPLPHRARWMLLWLGNTKFLVGVQGVIVDEVGRVLLLRHTYRRHDPWGLPGGFVAGREPPASALARELAEETGLAIDVGAAFHVFTWEQRSQIDVYFLCHYRGGVFRPNAEIAAMRFHTLDDLPTEMLDKWAILDEALALWRARDKEEGAIGPMPG